MGHIYMNEGILKLLPGTKRNVPLAPYTTFKIGGKATYFYIAKSTGNIIEAVNIAKSLKLPFFVLAGGSNLLVSDRGFKGLVIKVQSGGYKVEGDTLHAEAGVSMETLVKETGKKGLSGFQWAGGLPGSVGGAVRGNGGAFGGEMKDSIISISILDGKGNVKTLTKKQCKFSYRDSLIKQKNFNLLSCIFK